MGVRWGNIIPSWQRTSLYFNHRVDFSSAFFFLNSCYGYRLNTTNYSYQIIIWKSYFFLSFVRCHSLARGTWYKFKTNHTASCSQYFRRNRAKFDGKLSIFWFMYNIHIVIWSSYKDGATHIHTHKHKYKLWKWHSLFSSFI